MRFPKPGQSLIAAAATLSAVLAFPAEPKKPRLELRVMPLLGPPSTEFLFIAELKGGDDSEGFYCPTLEWQWGKEDASVQEPECPSYQAGRDEDGATLHPLARVPGRRIAHRHADPDEGRQDAGEGHHLAPRDVGEERANGQHRRGALSR
jgi:hypothetical protein